MIALACMLAFGQLDRGSDASDGGVTTGSEIVVLDVVRGSVLVRPEDGGVLERVMVEEGCYLPADSCIRAGKQKARTEAKLEEENTQGAKWVAVAFGSGVAFGAVVVVVLGLATGVVKR